MDQKPRKPIQLEDLLQLKKAERPAPEFWDRFDRELKQRQLQCLVKRSRFQRVASVIPFPAMLKLAPLGAAAALAFSLIPASSLKVSSSHTSLASANPFIDEAFVTCEIVTEQMDMGAPQFSTFKTQLSSGPGALQHKAQVASLNFAPSKPSMF